MKFPKRKLVSIIISFSETDHTCEKLKDIINKKITNSSIVYIIKSKNKTELLDIISNKVKEYSPLYDILFILSSSDWYIDGNKKYIKFYDDKISDYELCEKMYTNIDIFCTSLSFVDIWPNNSILDFPWKSTLGYVFNLPLGKWYNFYNPNSYCINICNKNISCTDIICDYLQNNSVFDFKTLFYMFKTRSNKTAIISRT